MQSIAQFARGYSHSVHTYQATQCLWPAYSRALGTIQGSRPQKLGCSVRVTRFLRPCTGRPASSLRPNTGTANYSVCRQISNGTAARLPQANLYITVPPNARIMGACQWWPS
ncbi:unnamed protein product [Ectocarpus sp. 12 AP-2014]